MSWIGCAWWLAALQVAGAPPAVIVKDTTIEVRQTIPFKAGGAELPASSKGLLDELAAALEANPRFTRVRIEGHTDTSGDELANLRLSQRRANTVRTALIARAVDANRLEAEGFGSSKPIASNATAAGRTQNRRVAVSVLEVEGRRIVAKRPPLAKVSAARNDVDATDPAAEAWTDAAVGLGLHRAWRVRTADASSAGITFRDATGIEMRQQSLVIIYGASQQRSEVIGRALLQSGALTSRLGELAGETPLWVETAAGDAELAQGRALVRVGEDGSSTVSNFEGKPASVYGKKKNGKRMKKKVKVAKGFGSKVEKGKAPSPPQKLPDAPAFDVTAEVRLLTLPGQLAEVTGSWSEVAGASRYRVELSAVAGAGSAAAPLSVEVPATVRDFRLKEIPPGRYLAQVSTLTDDGFESLPSAPLTFNVEQVTFTGSDGFEIDVGVPLQPGDTLQAPEGVRCSVDEGEPTGEVRVGPQSTTATCVDQANRTLATLPLQVTPLQVRVGESSLARGKRSTVRVELATSSRSFPQDEITVIATGAQAAVRPAEPGAEGNPAILVDLLVDPKADAVDLVVGFRGTVLHRQRLTVNKDKTPPVVEDVVVTRAEGGIDIAVRARDEGSGLSYVQAAWASEEGGVFLQDVGEGRFVGTLPYAAATSSDAADGQVTVRAADKALNAAAPVTVAAPPPEPSVPLWAWSFAAVPAAVALVPLVGAVALSLDAVSFLIGGPWLVGIVDPNQTVGLPRDDVATLERFGALSLIVVTGGLLATAGVATTFLLLADVE